ncbi:DUF7573 domain-containing protein, partial [Halorussus sp. GCM10023401]
SVATDAADAEGTDAEAGGTVAPNETDTAASGETDTAELNGETDAESGPEDGDVESDATDGDVETAPSDASDGTEASAVEPAVSTYGWSPAGGECAACGEAVERRWRADGEREGDLVCEDCKDW